MDLTQYFRRWEPTKRWWNTRLFQQILHVWPCEDFVCQNLRILRDLKDWWLYILYNKRLLATLISTKGGNTLVITSFGKNITLLTPMRVVFSPFWPSVSWSELCIESKLKSSKQCFLSHFQMRKYGSSAVIWTLTTTVSLYRCVWLYHSVRLYI